MIKNTNKKKEKIKLTTNENNKELNDDEFIKCSNDYELNNLSYKLALKYDKRECCEYYFSLIRTKQLSSDY